MKKYLYILTTAIMLVMAGCQPQNEDSSIALNWRINELSVNPSSSMNIIAAVHHDVLPEDRLAAFCQGVCIGVCAPVDTDFGSRFYLCIFQPSEPSSPITLLYYSAKDKRIYSSKDEILYTDDAVLGLASEPYWLAIKN